MRVRRFVATVQVNDQYLRLGTDPMAYVRQTLALELSGPLIGPRGGHYAPFGPIAIDHPMRADDFVYARTTFRGMTEARYVRLHHATIEKSEPDAVSPSISPDSAQTSASSRSGDDSPGSPV